MERASMDRASMNSADGVDRTEQYSRHLQEMCRIPTVSNADPEAMDLDAFLRLHAYLEETWPLCHQKMRKEVVGKCGLLYHYESRHPNGQLPLLLMAHQDVVPVGDGSMWTCPPFAAEVHDGMIYARGCTDSKCNIQAYFDALEELFADGFDPGYDIWLAFGYNEETMAGPETAAASLLSRELAVRGLEFGLVLDECGGIEESADGARYGQIYIAEKGYADVRFTRRSAGGHSAIPGPHTALGEIAQTACLIEAHPMAPFRTEAAVRMLEGLAAFMPAGRMKDLCTDVAGNWEELLPLLQEDRLYNALTRTTSAVTMSGASPQANVCPENAWIVVNNRILPGQTLEDLLAHFRSFVPEGTEISVQGFHDPPPVQSVDTEGYRLISRIFSEMYPGLTLIPSMLFGGTDSRYYCGLCPSGSVYRFTGLQWDPRWSGTSHQVDERIPLDVLAPNVDFYKRLLGGYGDAI